MRVVEVERISSVMKIFQNKQPFEVSVATANEHIDDSTGRLAIYVPKERRAQELCFTSVLPRKLAAWLMGPPKSLADGLVDTDAVKVLTAIFASERSVLDDVLDDQGILKVSFENEDHEYDSSETEEDQAEGEEDEGQEQRSSDNHFEADGQSSEQLTPSHSTVDIGALPYAELSETMPEESLYGTLVETISQQSHMSAQPSAGRVYHPSLEDLIPGSSHSLRRPSDRTPSNFPSAMTSLSDQRLSEDARYRVILDRVIEKAQNAAFPSQGSFDMSDIRNALPDGNTDAHESFDGLDVMSQFRSANQLERDKKVGAAGELYVSNSRLYVAGFQG